MADPARRGLGRGLAALLGDPTAPAHPGGLAHLGLTSIRPNPEQPRRTIDPAALESLAASIRASGLVQPVVVRPIGDGTYELVAGERRWRAAALAGLERVPALVRTADERERLELALVENMVREDLNPIEVARACAALLEDFGQSASTLGERLGRSRPAIANLVRLLELPDEVQALVVAGDLSEGHARAVLMADGAGARRRLAARVVEEGLSVRETEALARKGAPPRRRARPLDAPTPAADEAVDAFFGAFGAPVRARAGRRGGIVVEVRFPDEESLRRAIARIT